MTKYSSAEAYLADLKGFGVLPEGFRGHSVPTTFYPEEKPSSDPFRMNVSLVMLDEPTDAFGAVFTRNAFPGAPVILGRLRLAEAQASGVLINTKISNVAAANGVQSAETLLASVGRLTGRPGASFFPASTGVIGWKLPVPAIESVLPDLVAGLRRDCAVDLARGIMTTDRYPKLRAVKLGEGSILGFAKGAGMIEPNLATMLVFLLTDVAVERAVLRRILSEVAEETFNRISVDSDQSTSDTALMFSSKRKPSVPESDFRAALTEVCAALAENIVRNGEGTAHVIRVVVKGAPDRTTAVGAAKNIVNSPLVKTAVCGNDPNVGRIVSSIGDYLGNRGLSADPAKLRISIGGRVIFSDASFRLDFTSEAAISEYLRNAAMDPALKGYPQGDSRVEIVVELGMGDASAEVLGSDLTGEYVRENADYRS